jgi:hypothetical protein
MSQQPGTERTAIGITIRGIFIAVASFNVIQGCSGGHKGHKEL